MQKYVEYDRSYADMTYYFQILDLIPRVNLPKFEYLYLYFGKSMSEKSENAYESISHEDCYKTMEAPSEAHINCMGPTLWRTIAITSVTALVIPSPRSSIITVIYILVM